MPGESSRRISHERRDPRPSSDCGPEAMPRLWIGVDVGGTKIESVALDDAGREHGRHRRPTPRGDYDATIEAIVEVVRRAERACGDHAVAGTVGIGAPGSVSPRTGLQRNANSTCLNGRPFRSDLERALGRPVVLANDADCLALSESHDGAARDAQVAFAVILGTGCGGGVVANRRLLRGRNGIAGEWGHNPLPRVGTEDEPLPARRCWCGKVDCLEAWISGPAIEADPKGAERLDARLARALAVVVNLIDPDLIVLGGGVSLRAGLAEAVERLLPPLLFADEASVLVRRAEHGDSSGVRGAARLAMAGHA